MLIYFYSFFHLKSCALHPFHRCLQGAADRAWLCTRLLLWLLAGPTGAQGWVRVVQPPRALVMVCF